MRMEVFGIALEGGRADAVMMDDTALLELFERTGALLKGHFVLRSGLHSEHFFQCARVCEHMDAVTQLASALLTRLGSTRYDTVLAPAMGGLVIGQEVARQAGKRFVFVEKVDNKLELRRGFKFDPGERVLIVEDVITRGGRVGETLSITREHGAEPVGVAVLVDRSSGKASFDVPLTALLQMSFPTYPPQELPEHLAGTPAIKPGS